MEILLTVHRVSPDDGRDHKAAFCGHDEALQQEQQVFSLSSTGFDLPAENRVRLKKR